MAANTKNAAHIVRVLGSGCRESMLMSGSFRANPLHVNSPLRLAATALRWSADPGGGWQSPSQRTCPRISKRPLAGDQRSRDERAGTASMYGARVAPERCAAPRRCGTQWAFVSYSDPSVANQLPPPRCRAGVVSRRASAERAQQVVAVVQHQRGRVERALDFGFPDCATRATRSSNRLRPRARERNVTLRRPGRSPSQRSCTD
jgi:hypothetical protein